MEPAAIKASEIPSPEAPASTPAAARGAAVEAMLRGALLESRPRWRDIAGLTADLAFETDAAGRLVFLAPDPMLGWEVGRLLDHPPGQLVMHPGPDPFAFRNPARGLRAWLRRADGRPACLAFNLAPLHDAAGGFAGLRGAARDVTAEMAMAEAQAAALRRSTALERMTERLSHELQAPRRLAAALDLLLPGLGCAGAAVLELRPPQGEMAGEVAVVQRRGADPTSLLPLLRPYAAAQEARFLRGPGWEPLALLPRPGSASPCPALLAWRAPGGRDFDGDDRPLLAAMAELVFVTLGHQVLQRELELQARTEPLTGLLNRRAFLADLRRRLDRLAGVAPGAGQPAGALLFIDLDNFKPINDLLGHDAGDAALVAVAGLLQEMVRQGDLVARLGGDEFAVWLEGADAGVAAKRAAALCRAAPALLPGLVPALERHGAGPPTLSIGCALRHGSANTPETLLARADAAMYASKRAGRNNWAMAPDPASA